MRLISLNARQALDAPTTDEIFVVLIRISHDDLDAPVRLSTDPTQRITDDPLTYGTLSTWQTDDGSPFFFCLVSALVPGDEDDGQPQAALVFDNVDNDIAAALRSFTDYAVVDLAVVLASSADVIEQEWIGFKLLSASGDAGTVSLTISLDPITAEPWPARRMTRQSFPGLYR